MLFFTGHGVEKNGVAYYAPSDFELGREETTAFSLTRAMNKLARSRAAVRMAIVDACRDSTSFSLPYANAVLPLSYADDSILLFQSCQQGQVSYEGGRGEAADVHNGFFSLSILEALERFSAADFDRDGALYFSELFTYVSKRTNELATRYYGRSQIPVLSGNLTDFPFVSWDVSIQREVDALTRQLRRAVELGDNPKIYVSIEQAALVDKLDESSPVYQYVENQRRKVLDLVEQTWNSKTPGERRSFKFKDVEFAFRYCPPGEFVMGSLEDDPSRFKDETQHEVVLSKGFWILETEVTQEMWTVMGEENKSVHVGAKRPVQFVCKKDCERFCEKLNTLKLMPPGWKAMLPSEAQWEYAARAGAETPFPWGMKYDGTKCNGGCREPRAVDGSAVDENGASAGRVVEVGGYSPNAWGLYDVIGNVAERVRGGYGAYNVGEKDGHTNARPRSETEICRGGSYLDGVDRCRLAARDRLEVGGKRDDLGLRVVLVQRSWVASQIVACRRTSSDASIDKTNDVDEENKDDEESDDENEF